MTSEGQAETDRANTQVRAIESPVVPLLLLPHYTDPGPASSDLHGLSHRLRSNTFPDASFIWKSLTHDSFIRHPLNTCSTDPRVWHGHKTNVMVQWTERNIMYQKLGKMLMKMEKRCTTK
ncbi:testis-expressed protein 33 [Solea solea]|uniref:testis-expressed protein 33 n=1 Tax=Solea solea TaxID=90069 RepID=UPI00272CB205|nr:testis-expressed protein 33 [Solea solea]